MTQPAVFARRATNTRSILARTLLAIAVLVPVSFLFATVWQSDSQKVAFTTQERRGITYLRALEPVTMALAQAQSAAVSGSTVSFDALDRAVLAAGTVDDQIGTSLRTQDRWSGIRTKIQQLHTRTIVGPTAAYTAYSEITGLVLALTQKVRDESGLIRDPDADTYYLEDAAASQLPEGVIAAGQYSDLIVMALHRPAAQQTSAIEDIIAARAQLLSNANSLGDDVSLAIAATASQTLSGDLLAKLDRFRLGTDALIPVGVLSNGHVSTASSAQASTNKAEVQDAAVDLSAAMLTATDRLLVKRIDTVKSNEQTMILTLVAAILIALTPLTLVLVPRGGRRAPNRAREGTRRHGVVPASRDAGRGGLVGSGTRDESDRAGAAYQGPMDRVRVRRGTQEEPVTETDRVPALPGTRPRAQRPSTSQWDGPGAAR